MAKDAPALVAFGKAVEGSAPMMRFGAPVRGGAIPQSAIKSNATIAHSPAACFGWMCSPPGEGADARQFERQCIYLYAG